MGTTVRTKVHKKQQPIVHTIQDADYGRRLEQAILELEDAVFNVLNTDKGGAFHDVDFLYWSRKLKNIAAQVSMALSECRGQRHFHHHYRHDPKDHEKLIPVAGPSPLETLARVCREAVTQCSEMVGLQDDQVMYDRSRLEHAARSFLSRYQPAGNGKSN